MPIVTNLDLMLVKRKMTLTELSEKVGVTLANLSILKQNKARAIRFSTLEAICLALNCQPGDLLKFKRQKDAEEQTEDDGDGERGYEDEPVVLTTRVAMTQRGGCGTSRQR